MIELPEAITIATQMDYELKGKKIEYGNRGNSPHKFAFYTRSPEEYESIFANKTIGESKDHGSLIVTEIGSDHKLVLGGGGEKILLHQSEKAIPKKYQLLLEFSDETYLTVTVQGWGHAQLFTHSEFTARHQSNGHSVSPVSKDFTYDHFQSLFDELREDDPRSAKFFIISKPGIWGVGNGYAHPNPRKIK